MGPIGWPETSVRSYDYCMRNNPEERSYEGNLLFSEASISVFEPAPSPIQSVLKAFPHEAYNSILSNGEARNIRVFRPDVDEICALLVRYTAYSGNSLPTFRNNISDLSSKVKKSKSWTSSWTSSPLKMGQIGCTETSVRNCHSALRNVPGERRT